MGTARGFPVFIIITCIARLLKGTYYDVFVLSLTWVFCVIGLGIYAETGWAVGRPLDLDSIELLV